MALTDVQIGTLAIQLKETIRNHFSKKQEDSTTSLDVERDSVLAEILMTTSPDSLDDKCPDGYADLQRDDKHSVIERALASLTVGNGLVFDAPAQPRWIRVAIAHQGRTPLGKEEDYRWIRLASIDQVIRCVAFGAATDTRGWGWNLQVKTNLGDVFYASDESYRGKLINAPQLDLMAAIDAAVKAMSEPVPLGAQPKRV
ncbi:hypothetical protein [Pseudomonas syringae]|uniref:hypothetical protein n=1 Tax=Pseudomonas syringae TaxID=317 RepID=UPI00273F24D4|nr:hypothetical protein [Pseudomonas syringae]MDP5168596.1 hypothetical protein [Pseudomonas syringae pv. aptata str. DSM 50252]